MGKNKKKKKDRRTVKEILGDMGDKVGDAVRNTLGNVNQGIGNVVNEVGNATTWLALAPFAIPMKTILRARGIPVPRKLDDIAKTFYANVLHKQAFEEYFTVHQAAVKLGRHSAKVRNNFASYHFEQTAQQGDHLAVAALTAAAGIVMGIVNWFKERKEKQKAGDQLPTEEQRALNEYETGLTKGGGNNDERAVDEDGESGAGLWAIIIGAAVFLAIIIFVATR